MVSSSYEDIAMKRRRFLNILITILILVSFSLTSCITTSTFESTAEEYDYALHYALEKANESAITTLFFKITQTDAFLPDSLSFIKDNANNIPGMNKLLSEWTTYMASYTMDWFEYLRSYLNELVSAMTFASPIETVLASDDSASKAFEQAFGNEIKNTLTENLENIDLEKWEEIVTQYRAWVETNKILFDDDNTPLEDVDIRSELASYTCNLYFSSLQAAEVLLRTTPDPNADKTVSKVFGLD